MFRYYIMVYNNMMLCLGILLKINNKLNRNEKKKTEKLVRCYIIIYFVLAEFPYYFVQYSVCFLSHSLFYVCARTKLPDRTHMHASSNLNRMIYNIA